MLNRCSDIKNVFDEGRILSEGMSEAIKKDFLKLTGYPYVQQQYIRGMAVGPKNFIWNHV